MGMPEGTAMPAPKTSWTIMLYIAADSTLANFAVESLKQLNKSARLAKADPPDPAPDPTGYTGVEADVVVAAQFSIDAPGGQKIKRYIFRKPGTEPATAKPGTENLSGNERDPLDARDNLSLSEKESLESFLEWVYTNKEWQSQHYALILWSHGPELFLQPPAGGKTGDSASLYLTPEDLRQALSKFNGKDHKLDIVGFDACSMSMFEMAYEIKDQAKLMIASQEEVPDASFPYYDLVQLFRREGNTWGLLLDTLSPNVSENKQASPSNENGLNQALEESFKDVRSGVGAGVTAYLNAYQDYIVGTHTGMNPVTLSVLNLAMCKGLMEAVRDLARALMDAKEYPQLPRRLIRARKNSQDYAGGLYVDLHEFCTNLSEQLGKANETDYPNLSKELDKAKGTKKWSDAKVNITSKCEEVLKLLTPSPTSLILVNGAVTETGKPLINGKVIEAGKALNKDIQNPNHGISIYLPYLTDRQFDDTVNRPLVKGGRGTNGGKGIPNGLNAAAGDYLLSTLQTLILATESYYGDLQLAQDTKWYSFITNQWTKAIVDTDPDPKFHYSTRQIEINLGWKPRGGH